MIRSLMLLLTLAMPLAAQSGFYLDLSGPWHISKDDNSAMAAPEYDDSGWRLQMPAEASRLNFRCWLRRQVDLPDGTDRRRLALTLGALKNNYAVYVNGRHIATVGSLETSAKSEIAQPHTFPIPPEAWKAGPRQIIAIRLGRFARQSVAWRLDRPGSYLLTYLDQAPVTEGADALALRRERLTPVLIISIVYLMLCIPLTMAWWGERHRRELLWLSAFLVMSAAYGVQSVLSLTPGAMVFNQYGYAMIQVFTRYGTFATYGSFVIAAAGFRSPWLHAAQWLAWIGLQVGFSLDANYLFLYNLFSNGLSLVVIAIAAWTLRRETARPTQYFWLLALALPAIERPLSLLAGGPSNVGERLLSWGGYLIPLAQVMALLLTSVILFLLLRQVAADRHEQQRLKGEMEAARSVQALMLGAGRSGGFAVDPVYEPAQEVGGDFHWTRSTSDGVLIVVVGDVSGKGLKAAMLVSVAIGILRNEKSVSPAAILGALNEGLTGQTGGGFVTGCCARFDPGGTVTVANAGHPAPYCEGQEVALDAGLPLGIAAGAAYGESVSEGEGFTFVSDGVVEATNRRGELFGFDRTREISTKAAQEIADAAKAWGQNDDITVVTVRKRS